ncbi:hypothetical protein D3C81_2052700 [compost metagenome]
MQLCQDGGDAYLHLVGGFVGEGEGEDAAGFGAEIEEGDVADDQRESFAAACTRFIRQRLIKRHQSILLHIFW